jgi:hypothetical protein
MSASIGWWALPLLTTFGAWSWAWWYCSTEEINRGGWFTFRAYPLVAVPAATIVSLSAWLIWSLLT